MLYPTIDELTKGNQFNRYELALATAKCARLITDEYVRQHDVAEKSQTGNKETDKPINTMIDRELRDEKAVKVAIGRLYRGEYEIDLEAGNAPAQVVAEEIEPEAVVDVEITTADEQDDAADEALQDGDETAE
jgi:DNA-directed RNA polymerase subunit K/omega